MVFPSGENVVVCVDEEKRVYAVSMNHGPFGRQSVVISGDDYQKWMNGEMVMQDFSEKYFPQYHNGETLKPVVDDVIRVIKERVTDPAIHTFNDKQKDSLEKLKYLSGDPKTMDHNFSKVMDMAEEQLQGEGASKDRLSDVRNEMMTFAAGKHMEYEKTVALNRLNEVMELAPLGHGTMTIFTGNTTFPVKDYDWLDMEKVIADGGGIPSAHHIKNIEGEGLGILMFEGKNETFVPVNKLRPDDIYHVIEGYESSVIAGIVDDQPIRFKSPVVIERHTDIGEKFTDAIHEVRLKDSDLQFSVSRSNANVKNRHMDVYITSREVLDPLFDKVMELQKVLSPTEKEMIKFYVDPEEYDYDGPDFDNAAYEDFEMEINVAERHAANMEPLTLREKAILAEEIKEFDKQSTYSKLEDDFPDYHEEFFGHLEESWEIHENEIENVEYYVTHEVLLDSPSDKNQYKKDVIREKYDEFASDEGMNPLYIVADVKLPNGEIKENCIIKLDSDVSSDADKYVTYKYDSIQAFFEELENDKLGYEIINPWKADLDFGVDVERYVKHDEKQDNIKDTTMDKNLDPAMSARIATLLYLLPEEGKKIDFYGKIPLDDMIKADPISSSEIESITNVGDGRFAVQDEFFDIPFEELTGEQQELMVAKALIWSNDNMKKNGVVTGMFNALDECRKAMGNEFPIYGAFIYDFKEGYIIDKVVYNEEEQMYYGYDETNDNHCEISKNMSLDDTKSICSKAYISLIVNALGDKESMTLKDPIDIINDDNHKFTVKSIEKDSSGYGVNLIGKYADDYDGGVEESYIDATEIQYEFSPAALKRLAEHIDKGREVSKGQDQRPLIKVMFDKDLSNSRGRDYYLGDNGRYFTRQPEGAIQYDNDGKAIKDNWKWVICTDNYDLEPDYGYDKYARFEIVDSLNEEVQEELPLTPAGDRIDVGVKVTWRDPDIDNRDMSRIWEVDKINGEVISISDGYSEAEVTANELNVVDTNKRSYGEVFKEAESLLQKFLPNYGDGMNFKPDDAPDVTRNTCAAFIVNTGTDIAKVIDDYSDQYSFFDVSTSKGQKIFSIVSVMSVFQQSQLEKYITAMKEHGAEAIELYNLRKEVIADLKEHVVNPGIRSFSDDAVQRIRDYSKAMLEGQERGVEGMAIIDSIKDIIQADPEVARTPKQWFTDAAKEFDDIVNGDKLSEQMHIHFHR